jgi:hypothetical protein
MLSSVLNIASTFEAERLSWRWYYGIYAIAVGIGLILAFFCCPETRFARPPASFNGQVHVTDEYGEQRVVSGEEAAAYSSYAATDVDMTPLTYGETLKVWNGVPEGGWKLAGKSYISMARCLTSPGLLWAVIYTGMVLAVSIALALSTLSAAYLDRADPPRSLRHRPHHQAWLARRQHGPHYGRCRARRSRCQLLRWLPHGQARTPECEEERRQAQA